MIIVQEKFHKDLLRFIKIKNSTFLLLFIIFYSSLDYITYELVLFCVVSKTTVKTTDNFPFKRTEFIPKM